MAALALVSIRIPVRELGPTISGEEKSSEVGSFDGHFPRWGLAAAGIERSAEAVLDLFLDGIAVR
jgi:hypothetical protein